MMYCYTSPSENVLASACLLIALMLLVAPSRLLRKLDKGSPLRPKAAFVVHRITGPVALASLGIGGLMDYTALVGTGLCVLVLGVMIPVRLATRRAGTTPESEAGVQADYPEHSASEMNSRTDADGDTQNACKRWT